MPDDNELRLRENVEGRHCGMRIVYNEGFVAGDRLVCHFGVAAGDESDDALEGQAPSPEDTRRIEVAWNMHDDLVASLMETRDAAAMLCRFIAEYVSVEFADRVPDDYDGFGARADAILKKAQDGQVARGEKGDAEGEET